MIKPTIGRVVWFQPAKPADQPLRDQPYPGLIAYVHSDTCINLGYFNENGTACSATSVTLVQEGEDVPANGYYAEWMPYQVGQAKKHEQAAPSTTTASTLPPHQQRVVDEKCELDEKLVKLAAFIDKQNPIFAGLDEVEQRRLRNQASAMALYSNILGERIAAF